MPVLGKVGLVNKGTYNASTAYTALDFVKYNGSSFVALKGVQGVTPSDDGTNWAYLAKGVDVAVANSQTITATGTALDAVQANKNVNGSLAYNIDQQITSLNDSLASFSIRSVTQAYDIVASGSMHANLKTLIDADLPTGYTCLGVVGFTTNHIGVYLNAVGYRASDYSLQARNATEGQRTGNIQVWYLCYKS